MCCIKPDQSLKLFLDYKPILKVYLDKITTSGLSYELGLHSERKKTMETGILLKMDIVHYIDFSQPRNAKSLRGNVYYDTVI